MALLEEGERGRLRGLDPCLVLLVALIVIMAAFYSYFFFAQHLPLRDAGADSYGHLGLLRNVESRMGLGEDLDPGLFPSLYEGNERSGINYVIMSLIAALPGTSNLTALYLFGLLGIAVFLSGIYYLTLTLSGSSRAALLAAFLSLLLGSTESFARGNSFSLVELLAYAHYASTLAIGLMMYALGFNIRYLIKGTWKLYVVQLLLVAVIFNVHMLTCASYFITLVILVAVYAAWDKRFTKRHLLLLSLIPAVLVLASLWPLYHWWEVFQGRGITIGEPGSKFSSVSYFLETNVLFLIGLPFLIRLGRERVFLLIWALAMALAALSFLFPVSLAYYWRFAYVMRIPLIIGLALGLGMDIWSLARWRLAAPALIMAITAVFIGFSVWISVLKFDRIMASNAFAAVEAFPEYSGEGTNLAAYPLQGYNLMGISTYSVISVMKGHGDPAIVNERNDRLGSAFFAPEPGEWRGLLDEFNLGQALLNRSKAFLDVALLLNGTRLERNDLYDLYEVGAAGLDTEILSSTPDPELEESSLVNGFVRFDSWADVQWLGEEEMVVEAAEEPGGEGRRYFSVTSEDEEGALIFVNRGYIEVDTTRTYSLTLNSRRTRGEPLVYLVLYQYEATSPEERLSALQKKIHRGFEDWKEREFIVGPESDPQADIVWKEGTRFVKIGVIPCYKSAGQVDVDYIDISPLP